MKINTTLSPADLSSDLSRFWDLSGQKIKSIEDNYDFDSGAPVFTRDGKYTAMGWTEWTEGFVYGSSFLQYDATGDESFLEIGKKHTVGRMASHVSHVGVHDHGFNNLSCYGNWLRLIREGKIEGTKGDIDFCELALKVSGAVQAARWSTTHEGGGYIYSFNGPHSLFVDTIRSCRILMVAHALGHTLMGENDAPNSLLERAVQHISATANYNVFYGEGRDSYDEWGRTAHEAVFNTNDGRFRCPNAQQGFSGFTTWTRGLSWAMVGFAEELEFIDTLDDAAFVDFGGKEAFKATCLKGAKATCDWFIDNTATDGITYWDGGAPNLHRLGDWRNEVSNPYNDWEPIDSTAAAIGAQGLLRLGRYLGLESEDGKRYWQAGLTSMKSMLSAPYLSEDENHQGLLLHSIYHQPNGWDNVPEGQKVACNESSQWGDYHIREAALYLQRIINDETYYTFFGCL
ncbi:glycoside hydrolase family 88 protein [Opitutia bacterium ISCC 51]|nr:glycoside hydrolase family 88 protein [Opitutae bacterium ISCC 51]QXD28165.1 glycoside hydrolase family 88 protein [Opitutae bacterium ISCC 52]